jgi:hypothetical protein
MLRSKLSIPVFALALLFANGLTFDTAGHAARPGAQDEEKSLDVERYPNEPLELVELKVGEQPVKDKLTAKARRNDEGLDTVRFKEKEGWFKRVSARLRNVSGRPVTGLRAYLYFKSNATQALFRMPLMRSKTLTGGGLQPGAEIELTVSDQSWEQTADILRQSGADAELSSVTFSVESVMFGDDTQWHRGKLLRRDPHTPGRWEPAGAKAAAAIDKLGRQARPTTVAFKPGAARRGLRRPLSA